MASIITKRYSSVIKSLEAVERLAKTARHMGMRELVALTEEYLATSRKFQTDLRRLMDDRSVMATPPVPELYSPPRVINPYHEKLKGSGTGAYRMKNGRWKAKASLNGRAYHLGYYQTQGEARAAYNAFWRDRALGLPVKI